MTISTFHNHLLRLLGHSYISLSSFIGILMYTTGGGLGWMIGAVNDALSWRWTFHILGIAGLVMVPMAMLAMWEPSSVRNSRKARRNGKPSYSIKVCCVTIFFTFSFANFIRLCISLHNVAMVSYNNIF